MSLVLETMNRGAVPDFGYCFSDLTRVRLGELPTMPLGQFSSYATTTLIRAHSLVATDQSAHIQRIADSVFKEIRGLKVRTTSNPRKQPRLIPLEINDQETIKA